MAKSKQPKSVIGPTQAPSPEPSNPADALRLGPIPVKTSPQQTLRRPFRFPTKPALSITTRASSVAPSNFSGGIDGRPVLAYIASNRSDIFCNASSAIARTARSGWSARTFCSGEM
jgi:hypothetical protein